MAILTSLLPAVSPLLGCSSAKTRLRPIGVMVCPVAQLNFSSTAFDPRKWTKVVFKMKDSGRQPQLILLKTKEETKPIIHLRQTLPSLMILMFLLDLVYLRHLLNLMSLEVLLAYHQDGLHHLQVVGK